MRTNFPPHHAWEHIQCQIKIKNFLSKSNPPQLKLLRPAVGLSVSLPAHCCSLPKSSSIFLPQVLFRKFLIFLYKNHMQILQIYLGFLSYGDYRPEGHRMSCRDLCLQLFKHQFGLSLSFLPEIYRFLDLIAIVPLDGAIFIYR